MDCVYNHRRFLIMTKNKVTPMMKKSRMKRPTAELNKKKSTSYWQNRARPKKEPIQWQTKNNSPAPKSKSKQWLTTIGRQLGTQPRGRKGMWEGRNSSASGPTIKLPLNLKMTSGSQWNNTTTYLQ